jgi:hypothetical protein
VVEDEPLIAMLPVNLLDELECTVAAQDLMMGRRSWATLELFKVLTPN